MVRVKVNDVVLGEIPENVIRTKDTIFNSTTIETYSHYNRDDKFISIDSLKITNPLVGAVCYAFDNHLPLVLNPDIIWNTIIQNISIHINKDPDKYRDIYVSHTGEKELVVIRDNFIMGDKNNDWNGVSKEFVDKIIENCKSNILNNAMKLRFSTTTLIQDTVHNLNFMDMVKAYFSYIVLTRCGIPYIDIEGTQEDWINLKNSLNVLDELELFNWKNKLIVIIDNFINAFDDTKENNFEFWNGIFYKTGRNMSASDTTIINGWICNLFLYTNDLVYIDHSNDNIAIKPKEFITGRVSTPFIWKYYGTDYNMSFISGFVGVKIYNEEEKSITPELGWTIQNLSVLSK